MSLNSEDAGKPVARLLVRAARCWRDVLDPGEPTQPGLVKALGGAMLAPVLDSLCLLYQEAPGRTYHVGDAADFRSTSGACSACSPANGRHLCLDCSEAAATAFDCALCSTRIMLTRVPRGHA